MSINVGLVVLLIISMPLVCSIGAVEVHPGITLRIAPEHLTPQQWTILLPPSPIDEGIVQSTWPPHTLVSVACGTGLAVIDPAAQSILRNIPVGPYIPGISVGASTGAAAIMVFGLRMASSPVHVGVGVGVFIGSFVSFALVMTLARGVGRLTNTRMIFAGMAVNFFFSALTNLITMLTKNPATTRSIVFWMLDSLAGSYRPEVTIAMDISGAEILGLVTTDRRIDALSLGDDVAHTLDVDPRR